MANEQSKNWRREYQIDEITEAKGGFNFSFCYCFYDGFIHKIILVSRILPFICISYPLEVLKFDTRILRNLCAAPLLKTLSKLSQSIAFFMSDFVSHAFLSCASVTMIYRTSTEVLLNLVAPLNSAVPSFDFEQSMFFELLVLIPLVLYLIRSVSAEVSLNCISCIRFRCSFF